MIHESIGHGANGEIWRASDDEGRLVAIKTIDFNSNETKRARAKREIEVLSKLQGLNGQMLRFMDVIHKDDKLHIVTNYVEGCSVWEWLESGNVITELQLKSFLTSMLGVLQSLKEHGVLHRDISLGNIMLSDNNITRPVLIDFGSSSWGRNQQPLTTDETTLGTLDCSSPEHIDPTKLTHQSDLYSLGMVCYWLCKGATLEMHKNSVAKRFLSNLYNGPSLEVNLHDPQLESAINLMLKKVLFERAANSKQLLNSLEKPTEIKPIVVPKQHRGTSMTIAFVVVVGWVTALMILEIHEREQNQPKEPDYQTNLNNLNGKISAGSIATRIYNQSKTHAHIISIKRSVNNSQLTFNGDPNSQANIRADLVSAHTLRFAIEIKKRQNSSKLKMGNKLKWNNTKSKTEAYDGSSPL
jgi:serine/threonine protein kinase